MIPKNISDELKRIKRYSNFGGFVWVLIISLSLFWNLYSIRKQSEDIAISNAQTFFEKDSEFRKWASKHGGLYAPLNERTPSNPMLSHIPNRDIELPSGDSLTLMNPAYMLRQLQDEYNGSSQIISNITSLKPLQSENAPDSWERKALLEFENGKEEVIEFSKITGKEHLRVIRPLIMKEKCLKCHEVHGYKVGDIRGGISVSVPIESFGVLSSEIRNIAVHVSLILIGFIGIRSISKRFSKNIIVNQKVNTELFEKDERLKLALGATNAGVWDWNIQTREAFFNERWAEISGYTLEELAPIDIETWNELVHPDDLPQLDLLLEYHYKNGTEHYEYETRMRHKNGKWIWVQIRGKVITRDKNDNPIRMVGVIVDITNRKNSEEIIKNVNIQFSSIMNSLDAVVYVADMETYELLFINNALESVFGKVIGNICWQTIQKDQTGPCQFCTNNKLLTKDGKPGNTYTWEFQNTATNKWYLIKDKAIVWHDGRIVRLEIATDITESKESEIAIQQSEERFRTTFNQAVDSIFIAEISGGDIPIIHDINNAVTKNFGYTKKELIGKPMNAIHIYEKEEAIKKRVKTLLSGKKEIFETVAKKKDGSIIPIEMSAKRIRINNKYYIYIIERDITERKNWEKEILEVQQRLEEENANKDKFFSIISHDLKAPFGALLGIAELLEEDYDEMSDPERKEMIHIARKSAGNIYELLDGLLEWSLAKSGRMEFVPAIINLYDTSSQVIQILEQNAKSKNIGINNNLKENSTAYIDEKMYRTVLRNLIANAIKFTSKGGEINITSKKTKGKIEISVSDNGIGMTKEETEKLFRIEIHHTTLGTENESGTGVGLILCKELVEQNKGKIWVESEFGEGSTFKFTIPINF